MTKRKQKVKAVKAWADVGSHGHIFSFVAGPVGDRYPYLMHLFSQPISKHLVPVTITIPTPTHGKRRRGK